MFAWVILGAVMVGVAGLIAVAQLQAGATPPAAVSDAIARNCLAVFQGGSGHLTLPDGVSIQAVPTQCTIQAPYGVVTVGALAYSGNLIGAPWVIQSRNGQYVLRAQVPM
ncbi:MAG: hypothetical protein ACYCV6_02730 [Steroidobacteraceae bacterium]